jgi:hypothetical protein
MGTSVTTDDRSCINRLTLEKIVVGIRFLLVLWSLKVLMKLRGVVRVGKGGGVNAHYLAAVSAAGPFLTLFLYGI